MNNKKLISNNKPFFNGKEMAYMKEAISSNFIAGNGPFTRRCQEWFQNHLNFSETLLTTSCTDALEMCALLLRLKPGDEVIIPSYAFVSIANAFLIHGAKIRFADSYRDHPNVDPDSIESLINSNTKAIVVIHYAGVAVDIERIQSICAKHKIILIEDAAHSIGAKYKNQYLGSFGDLSVMSFHESKNITCGEGGCLIINNLAFAERAKIIHEKGTNRDQFRKGLINKYEWIDVGASYLLSDLNAAMLLSQLEQMVYINEMRRKVYDFYAEQLNDLNTKGILLPLIKSKDVVHNAHIFYLLMPNLNRRNEFLKAMEELGIWVVFHYLPLHQSPYFQEQYDGLPLPNSKNISDRLIRLPIHAGLSQTEQNQIVEAVKNAL